MSKVAHYLQEHLMGEVMTGSDARRYFATDGSIFAVLPSIIVYPRSENDVRKTARFTWQLAERGRIIPITARGAGTDQTGAALGQGIMLVFPAHMNRIIEFDSKSGVTVVEPGTNYGKLQQTLETHGRFLPPFPASMEYSTLGGAVANNAAGHKTVKYGATLNYVRSLRVVLANGEVIETGRLNKRDLSKKLGLATFEGEIYRAIDTLLEEHKDVLAGVPLATSKNAAGYNLAAVRRPDGSFDLTPLFVGSQGTLGIITEITFETADYNPETTLIMAQLGTLEAAQAAITELRAAMPASAIEMVDQHLLNAVHMTNPNLLKAIIEPPFPQVLLVVEYDDAHDRTQRRAVKRAQKILEHYASRVQTETEPERREQLWKVRQASAVVGTAAVGTKKAVPIIDDGIVPLDRFQEYMEAVYGMFQRYRLQVAAWGHAGDANLHLQTLLDLAQVGDRQLAFKLMDEYYTMVISLGGSTSGEHNDGRLRGPYLERLYGPEVYGLFRKVKQIFDPYGTLNPGVKVGVSLDDVRPLVRGTFSLDHFYDYLPRS